ncbi:MAG: hypothetical protein PGN37_01280 [Mycobacterium kyogaense]|uniref:hypothetical protein n=1 Tax=Mycobacterium kyogaense TaxID=2212479 RepID=UPI002FF8B318
MRTEIAKLAKARPDLSVFPTRAEWEAVRDPVQAVFSTVISWEPADESIFEDGEFETEDPDADEVDA